MIKLEPIIIDPETFLKHHCALPPLPEVLVNIQALINTAEANIEDISDLIVTDPALTAQILKIVNSAYYGLRNEVLDMKFAIAYIGFNEIYNIVLSLSIIETLNISEHKELESFWEHSVYCAQCAKFLARKFEPLLNPEIIWLGAVLHDIGKLVYFKFFPKHYKSIVELAETSGTLYSEVEKEFEIPSSSYLGQLLCKRWNLPGIINDACEFHTLGDINHVKQNHFRKIICCANLVAIITTAPLAEDIKQNIFEALIDIFNSSKEDWFILMGEIYDFKK